MTTTPESQILLSFALRPYVFELQAIPGQVEPNYYKQEAHGPWRSAWEPN